MTHPNFVGFGKRQDLREKFISHFPNMDNEWTIWKYEGGWHVHHKSWDLGERVFGTTLDALSFSLKYKATGGLKVCLQKSRSERKSRLLELARKS